jgi:hypothetical protein
MLIRIKQGRNWRFHSAQFDLPQSQELATGSSWISGRAPAQIEGECRMTMVSALRTRLESLRNSVALRIREVAMRREVAQEFANLGGRDLDRVLADIGCTRDELGTFINNAPHARPVLDAMILRLGLEKAFAFAEPTLLRDIERRCATCPTQGICRRWLGKRGSPAEYRLFCPNAGNFDQLNGKAAA